MQRIITGALLIALLVTAIAIGGWFFAIITTIALCIAMHEEYKQLTNQVHYRLVRWPAFFTCIIALPLIMFFSIQAIIPLMAFCLFFTIGTVVFRKDPDFNDILYSCLPPLTILLPGMFLISFLQVSPYILQLTLVGLVFLVSTLGDTFAFIFGNIFGGKKLAPLVSPSKTISGSIGGLIGSMAGALLAGGLGALISPGDIALLPSFFQLLLIGLLGGMAGQLGDLFASLLKRHLHIKDFSHLFPGHGGMMDRLDSILFTTVIIFCFHWMQVI